MLLILGLFAALYWQCYHSAEKHWIKREAEITAEFTQLIDQAKKHNADIQAQAEQSAKIIGETYDENHQTITDLAAANALLVAKLRQQSAAGSSQSRMPNATAATRFSNATDTGIGEFLQVAVQSAQIADETTETARACQSTLIIYQEAINGSTSAVN